MNAPLLNIIGAGRTGRTLGRLWHESSAFRIGAVVSRKSSKDAVSFIGSGWPCKTLEGLSPAPVWMITVPDDTIEPVCRTLANSGYFSKGTVVFHCSGALRATDGLEHAQAAGASIASIHPVKSFADPEYAVKSFSGTWCGTEGMARALGAVVPAFEKCGAKMFAIDPASKTLYHAASVMACNALPPLFDIALRAMEKAGIEKSQAAQILQPLAEETLINCFALGPRQALTGPAARGDKVLMARQQETIEDWNPEYAELYSLLMKLAVKLAREKK